MKYCDMCKMAQECHASGRCLLDPLIKSMGEVTISRNGYIEQVERERDEARGAMARLCRAVSRRMMPDEPTPEDTMELGEALDAASSILHNAKSAGTDASENKL